MQLHKNRAITVEMNLVSMVFDAKSVDNLALIEVSGGFGYDVALTLSIRNRAAMKFPGRRKNKHYFPITEKDRVNVNDSFSNEESFHIVGIDQLLVDIECNVDDAFLEKYNLTKGQSQIIGYRLCDEIYTLLKSQNRVTGEFAGGTVGNTLHNFCTLTDERAVLLGAITKNITIGDYSFKYISSTSSKVDLNHLQPCDSPMGRAMCFITPDGERTFGISKGCMNDLSSEFIPTAIIEKSCALLISAYILRDENSEISKATQKACEIARAAGVPIVLTLGTSSLVTDRHDFIFNFIKDYVNVVAMNLEEGQALVGIDDPLLALERTLEITDLVLLTVGAQGLYIGGYVDESRARRTSHELHTKSIVNYNQFEYSRGMTKSECEKPVKIYSHINPFMGGPVVIRNTNGAGDGALSALLHDMAANRYHRRKIPNSPKHAASYLTYSSFSQICKYSNRVSFEILNRNSPRLFRGLPEREESLDEAYWAQ
jgi:inosine kinase